MEIKKTVASNGIITMQIMFERKLRILKYAENNKLRNKSGLVS